MLNPILFFKALVDPTQAETSLRHTAYAVVIAAGCGWLTFWLIKGPRDLNWVAGFTALLSAVTAGKVMGGPPPVKSGETP